MHPKIYSKYDESKSKSEKDEYQSNEEINKQIFTKLALRK